MLDPAQLKLLHTNQRLVVEELQRRGVNVRILSWERELLEATYGRQKEFILDRDFSATSYPASIICGDKALSKTILAQAGISVPHGERFNIALTLDDALLYSQKTDFPLVVKPVFGSHGDHVSVNLEDIFELTKALKICRASKEYEILLEKHFSGKEYRIFVNKNEDYAVLHRDPAHVFGDGQNSIEQLITIENARRAKRRNCLCPIALDYVATEFLAKHNTDIQSIPSTGQKVYLRQTSNIAKGGVCEDVTGIAHPSAIKIAKQVLNLFPGLPYVGIDFMTPDIGQKQTSDSYVVLEVNTVPGVHMHMRPGIGKSQNVASYIADMIFPQTRGKYGKA